MKKKPAYISELAELQLDDILDFITNKWSLSARNSFLEKIKLSIAQVELYPKGCPEIKERKNVRKKVVTAQTSFFYIENEKDIDIVSIIDNRQDPKKIMKKIRL